MSKNNFLPPTRNLAAKVRNDRPVIFVLKIAFLGPQNHMSGNPLFTDFVLIAKLSFVTNKVHCSSPLDGEKPFAKSLCYPFLS